MRYFLIDFNSILPILCVFIPTLICVFSCYFRIERDNGNRFELFFFHSLFVALKQKSNVAINLFYEDHTKPFFFMICNWKEKSNISQNSVMNRSFIRYCHVKFFLFFRNQLEFFFVQNSSQCFEFIVLRTDVHQLLCFCFHFSIEKKNTDCIFIAWTQTFFI